MALINCPSCSKEISDTALKCPSCGHQVRKPKRTVLGKIIKWCFILFNIFMIYSVFKGMGGAGEVVANASSQAEQAGAAIGVGLGMTALAIMWVIGDIIIGMLVLFTRPKA